MLRVGINGFGRIGRAIYRANFDKKAFKIVAVNDINPDIGNIAYTLNYDSLYDRLPDPVRIDPLEGIIHNTRDRIRVFHEQAVTDVPWEEADVDVVIDASGVLANVLAARSLVEQGRVRKVLVTHSPEEGIDFTMVLGANEHLLDVEKHDVIASSICDATAIAPVLKLIQDRFGITSGYVTTLHPWLSYQNLMDGPASSWSVPGEIYHHYALGRSVIGNIIPKPTTAIEAACKVLDSVTEDMIGSFSYRTPTAIVGSADITLVTRDAVTKEELLAAIAAYERDQRWSILQGCAEPLVSLDFKKSKFSAVVDARWADVVGDNLVKLVLWYDNEWGYSCRVVDQVELLHKHMSVRTYADTFERS